MSRVYSFDFRQPDGDIYRIRGKGTTKAAARADAAKRFETIHGLEPFAVDERTATFVPEKQRGPDGI